MKIGIPKERKVEEYRVALTPEAIQSLQCEQFQFLVETQAGMGSGFSDEEYRDAGAKIVSQSELYKEAETICKVKEPIPEEWSFYKSHHYLFSYLHLAAYPGLTEFLLREKITSFAFETYCPKDRQLPLLKPMSQIAGRVGMLAGAQFLQKPLGGIGQLISGLGSVDPVQVLIVGAGNVGREAARVALGLGAKVILFDHYEAALEFAQEDLAGFPTGELQTEKYSPELFKSFLATSQVVVGAVLLPGGKAPILIDDEDYTLLPKGSVLVDISIDQGGCFAHSKPTTHLEPVFNYKGIQHYCVANIPGAVPRTSSEAISSALLPALEELKESSYTQLLKSNPAWQTALNTQGGELMLDALK